MCYFQILVQACYARTIRFADWTKNGNLSANVTWIVTELSPLCVAVTDRRTVMSVYFNNKRVNYNDR